MSGEKTEKATPRKLAQARKEGRVAKTQDLGAWAAVFVASVLFQVGVPPAMRRLAALLDQTRLTIADPQVPPALALLRQAGWTLVELVLPFAGTLLVVGVLASAAQGGVHLATKSLKPQVKRLNPLAGFKKIFGPHGAWEAVKSLVKTAVVGAVLWHTVQQLAPQLVGASALPLPATLGMVSHAALVLIRDAAATGLAMGVADYGIAYRKLSKSLKMSLQEVKDEHKQSEGDPAVKGQIRSRQLAMSRNRMMSAVAEADVVLVNPTHVAVALRYDPKKGAPRVVAKGSGTVAARIRAKAEEHRVPMVADVPLARALHRSCELGQEVPTELYAAVARVLAFVLSLKARGSAAGLHRVVPTPRPARAGAGPR